LDRSAIILAGGGSSRFGQDKGLLRLAGKPMIKYVMDAASGIVDEKIIVVKSEAQAKNFEKVVESGVTVVVDVNNMKGPLVGAHTGLQRARGRYSLLLPCDTPLVSRDILSHLAELSLNRNAVIPRYPNGYIEPLQAVYRTKPAFEATREALNQERLDLRSMIKKLKRVRYISTLVLRQLDPNLSTFYNVNSPKDLTKAEATLESLNPHQIR
jgi:molybdopterin-guanine dinucleotide biosynthesis protein A